MDEEPSKTTLQGHTRAKYLTDEQIECFLDCLLDGKTAQEAAEEAGSSLTQFRMRYEREPELEARVKQAVQEGTPNFRDRLRQVGHWHVFHDRNYKAWRDWAMVHLPEFEVLRTQKFEHTVSGSVQLEAAAREAFAGLSNEELEARIKYLESQKEEHPVIEIPAKTQAA